MLINVNLLASFRMIAGARADTLHMSDGATLKDVIDQVLKNHPKLNSHWLDEKGELRGHVHVYVNGYDANTFPQKLDTTVKENDEVDFIPPVAGG